MKQIEISKKGIMLSLIAITLMIGFINSASAMTIYAGESYSFKTEQFEYWSVVGNSSDMEGINISWENGNTTINFSRYYKPDNFTIILFNINKTIIEKPVYISSGGGGSSSKTKYIDRNITRTVPIYQDKIEYVDKEIVNEKIVFEQVGSNFWLIAMIILFILSTCAWIGWIIYKSRHKEIDPFNAEEELNSMEVY